MSASPDREIRALPLWDGEITVRPLSGGITNRNYLVEDRSRRAVVRLGADIPVHHIRRDNELAASRAAHAAGLSPRVLHHQPGLLVLDYIDAHALTPKEVRAPSMLERIVPLIRSCHREIPKHFRGAAAVFWVFHVVRDYAGELADRQSRHRPLLAELMDKADRLEKAAGPFEIVFGHNDLLAANLLDDGNRLWLIDWDYAGFNTPLFDLGGLASNNELSPADERRMLELYYERPVSDELIRRYEAMKCASLLRETMWSMISEIHSTLDFDYAAYTAENLQRFERAYDTFSHM
ncbi:phosphotransferase [Gellertiella hungarica]|uniref:Thiamine kinase-like enzyme n=1 Tax=Gellertiella hungarica TaxID=1572859 RepID=A0A7W6NJB3_9HYPH|nr:phosphotransferase [Gellertiella hungarica]MBB4064205.1 thiamine kinase-like enzyme [Gellertiella hungarica]